VLKLEVFLIRIAAKILMGRNTKRAMHVSRRDNNDMWYMAERLESISLRMENKYTEYSDD
jgi:hypothetical protein